VGHFNAPITTNDSAAEHGNEHDPGRARTGDCTPSATNTSIRIPTDGDDKKEEPPFGCESQDVLAKLPVTKQDREKTVSMKP
jgi:hypothetical protein